MTDDTGRILAIADELRALAANGVAYHVNEYDLERYHRVQALAAQLLTLVDSRSTVELERMFRGDLGIRTPQVAADAAVFDPSGRLLMVQRTDSAMWCMPGGAADVGERPSRTAEREALEETGLTVRATRLLGVYDNRNNLGRPVNPVHMYHLLFECEWLGGKPVVTNETLDVRWATRAEALALPLFGLHVRKVPAAFDLHDDPGAPVRFD